MRIIIPVMMLGFLLFCATPLKAAITNTSCKAPIIPKPVLTKIFPGQFLLNELCKIYIEPDNEEMRNLGEYCRQLVESSRGWHLPIVARPVGKDKTKAISLKLVSGQKQLGDEGYTLTVTSQKVQLEAASPVGLFYGLQTIRQFFTFGNKLKVDIPCLEIMDMPRYVWRGMMLDVSRHFFPKEFIKQFIDYLAMNKMNRFHWHLADDQGWRIEIKKYPRLTEVGAWRVDRETDPWDKRMPQQPDEKATYGGFYTQEEIREIVAYAKSRFITIIPEIEMPAHTLAALAAYPQYSCTGGPFTVVPGGYWPITNIYCAGNDSTFEFIENILSEVLDLFPGTYIHVGGDEADKSEWKRCAKCQLRIKQENLKDEGELQSYFTKHIEKFLSSNGRRLIGWDEILEGGLPPQATVMSWRGTEGGIAAAISGHDVVMAPTSHCYFDYYQGEPEFEPLAIGGNVPLQKVYSFEPTPDTLTAEQSQHILGAQANLWTEYVPNPKHAEYMIFPRSAALAEVAWSPKESRDWRDFIIRLDNYLHLLDSMGIQYATSSYRIIPEVKFDEVKSQLSVVLDSTAVKSTIHYTLDGSEPTLDSPLYKKPLILKKTVTLKAGQFQHGRLMAEISSQDFVFHKAIAKVVTLSQPYKDKYNGGGPWGLVNGILGSKNHADGNWQGFQQVDFEAMIDLGKNVSISSVTTRYLCNPGAWIFPPTEVRYAFSKDGQIFEEKSKFENIAPHEGDEVKIREIHESYQNLNARFVKIFAKNTAACPLGHVGAGDEAWLFIDEIQID